MYDWLFSWIFKVTKKFLSHKNINIVINNLLKYE